MKRVWSYSKPGRILVNRAKCGGCNHVITSKPGKTVRCRCGGLAVDGDTRWIGRGWDYAITTAKWVELSEYW